MRLALFVASVLLLDGCHSAPQEQQPEAQAHAMTSDSFAPLATIKSASIDLPADDETFGDSPQAQVLNTNCLACHSAAMVRTQPPLTAKQWTVTVDKMREAYGAPFDKSETGAIVQALTATQPSKP
jgi:mono/diheme cytochrome c family protein